MKTWITYLAALFMGFATCLTFGDSAVISALYSTLARFLIDLGVFLFIPIVIITFSSGIAALKKDNLGAKSFGTMVLWSVISTVILSLVAAIIFKFFPVKFPVSSSAGSDAAVISTYFSTITARGLGQLYPTNPIWSIATTTYYIVPILIISWILGISLKPNADVIRPAYTVMNSFSEVMYRISRTVTVYGFFLTYVASSNLFLQVYNEKTILVSASFTKLFIISAVFVLLILLPLLYAIFTGFKRNPYWVLYRSLASIATGFSTGHIITSTLVNESVERQNLGVQKRISSTSTPIYAVIGRGGTAFISTLVVLALLEAVGAELSFSTTILVGLAAALCSYLSALTAGYEILIVLYAVLQIIGVDLYGAEATVIAMLPFLSALSIALDTAIASLGSMIVAYYSRTDVKIPYRDIL